MLHTSRRLLPLWMALSALACGDDVTGSGDTEGGSSSSTSAAASSTTAQGTTVASSDSSGEGTSDTSGSSGASTSTSSADTDDTGGLTSSTGGDTGSSSGEGSTGTTGGTTGGESTVCEEGGEFVLEWFVQVPGGTFPTDIPTDLVSTCAFTPSGVPGELPIDCEEVELLFTIESTPLVALPDEGQSVDVRIRRQVGPLAFADLWVDLQFAGGQQLSLVNASVLQPDNATVDLPYDMDLSEDECGPFNVGTPFEPKDPCGEQLWLGVELDLDVPLTVFHGTHASGTAAGSDVGVWVQTARDYGVLPKTCDFAPRFFTTMVATAGE